MVITAEVARWENCAQPFFSGGNMSEAIDKLHTHTHLFEDESMMKWVLTISMRNQPTRHT